MRPPIGSRAYYVESRWTLANHARCSLALSPSADGRWRGQDTAQSSLTEGGRYWLLSWSPSTLLFGFDVQLSRDGDGIVSDHPRQRPDRRSERSCQQRRVDIVTSFFFSLLFFSRNPPHCAKFYQPVGIVACSRFFFHPNALPLSFSSFFSRGFHKTITSYDTTSFLLLFFAELFPLSGIYEYLPQALAALFCMAFSFFLAVVLGMNRNECCFVSS